MVLLLSPFRQALRHQNDIFLIFDKEPLLLVTDRDLNPGLPHAEYQLLYLAEIRLIRETEKPTNAQKIRMVDSLHLPLFPL